MTDQENRELGPEMQAERWIAIGGGHVIWLHPPSQRRISMEPSKRSQCDSPCWGPEPADPEADGYLVSCCVHDKLCNPMYGDAFWVESYATAIKMARRIRTEILAETPAQTLARKKEFNRRKGEAWAELMGMCAGNARIVGEK